MSLNGTGYDLRAGETRPEEQCLWGHLVLHEGPCPAGHPEGPVCPSEAVCICHCSRKAQRWGRHRRGSRSRLSGQTSFPGTGQATDHKRTPKYERANTSSSATSGQHIIKLCYTRRYYAHEVLWTGTFPNKRRRLRAEMGEQIWLGWAGWKYLNFMVINSGIWYFLNCIQWEHIYFVHFNEYVLRIWERKFLLLLKLIFSLSEYSSNHVIL